MRSGGGAVRVELPYVCAHQGEFCTPCIEAILVVDHQAPLDAENASNPPTWASNWPESASNSLTWSTTKAPSMQPAPNPPTWSTTNALSMQKTHRTQPRGRATGQKAHRTPLRGRPPKPLRCSRRRSQPRGRHLAPLDAPRAEALCRSLPPEILRSPSSPLGTFSRCKLYRLKGAELILGRGGLPCVPPVSCRIGRYRILR
jgi:hypothetical protein